MHSENSTKGKRSAMPGRSSSQSWICRVVKPERKMPTTAHKDNIGESAGPIVIDLNDFREAVRLIAEGGVQLLYGNTHLVSEDNRTGGGSVASDADSGISLFSIGIRIWQCLQSDL